MQNAYFVFCPVCQDLPAISAVSKKISKRQQRHCNFYQMSMMITMTIIDGDDDDHHHHHHDHGDDGDDDDDHWSSWSWWCRYHDDDDEDAVRSLEQVVEEVRAAFCHQALMSWVVGGEGKTMEYHTQEKDIVRDASARQIEP